MFQMWGKLVENNHILQDLTVCIDDEDTRTHKVFRALDEICDAWNLAKPIWLDTNISEFKISKYKSGQNTISLCFK